ncbi:PAS domain-containing protein [Rhizobium sp. CFBP 8762]|uniref:CheR family methyltransferase n=1 Tax=Rhizobium sp. CFBP 8762 TaxID=2775279 RepID=UPI00177EA1BF|nr:PAS domain-containing protein [Rhizobium sp. CFBP 8762]
MDLTLKPFPIIGVGASAGGIHALEGLFRGIGPSPDVAFVVVTHLNPTRESALHEVLERYTSLPIVVAKHNMAVEVNQVYVMPPNAVLTIERRILKIAPVDLRVRSRKPIDVFLSSLAQDCGEYAISIVLSGGDGDGTLGTKSIKERGGITFAQTYDEHGPDQPSMPQTAIATGVIDFAIPVTDMGNKIAALLRDIGTLDQLASSLDHEEQRAALNSARTEICNIILEQLGHDFSGYKAKTFLRRIARRMQVTQHASIEVYIAHLHQNPKEVVSLFRDLLINVTNFFRDADAFEKLAKLVVPKLFENKTTEDTIRIWVPGCATGEEVYSLAMLMQEHMKTVDAKPRVQIFATDIDDNALSVARAARYPEALLDNVSPERRSQFFTSDNGSFVIKKEVRDLCIFSPHSIIKDPPFSRIDLVSCRNLLIYFGNEIQSRVIPLFHYALKPDSFLFLGTAENVTHFGELFVPLERKSRIFRRREDVPKTRLPAMLSDTRSTLETALSVQKKQGGSIAFRNAVENRILERFSPAHVIVDRQGNIVFYSARTGKYLEPSAGVPNRQLVTMARRGLRLELGAAFRLTVETGERTVRPHVAVDGDDARVQMVTITAEIFRDGHSEEPLYLVLFTDEGPTISRQESLTPHYDSANSATLHLENELRDTRERLQSLVEEYETALEELKTSNEELVSLNEELQSTNEELEASKEELQSLNEELQTINQELSGKVEALDHANGDLRNLFHSTKVATIFLDRELVIRTFTPAVSTIFNLLDSDRGRPITDLSSKLHLPSLRDDIDVVFNTGKTLERQIVSAEDHSHFLMKLAPYKSMLEETDGVVISFIDVTSLTNAEANQRVLIAELQHRTRNLLAVVRSIAGQTVKTSGSLDEFRENFNDRLSALSRVQNLLSSFDGEPITIGGLIKMELSALNAAHDGKRIVVNGPEIPLKPSMVRTLALAIHELATNALKYGALASDEGQLSVGWEDISDDSGRSMKLVWAETGMNLTPGTPPPANSGFGRELIEQALPYQLGAKTQYEIAADGVRCTIVIALPQQYPETST